MKDGLRISFFGSSLLSAYWNGAATYYRGIIRALHELGHSITFYEPDVYDRQEHRDISDPSYAQCVIFAADMESTRRCLKLAEGSDIVIKTSGIGFQDEFLERAVLELQNSKTRVIFWDVDAPATLDRVQSNVADPFLPLIGCYDKIFTYGGGMKVVEAYKKLGARDCIPVYNALDPDIHFPVEPQRRFAGDLGFLGNRLPDREKRVREFFFNTAERLPEKTFLLGGNGWNGDVAIGSNVRILGHVFTEEHNVFNCSVKMVLNINRQSMAAYGYSPPTRIFEAAGAGACIITDKWEGIETFLVPEKECLVARSSTDVAGFVQEIDSAEAQKIGLAAMERVVSEHTYKKRAEIVNAVLLGNS